MIMSNTSKSEVRSVVRPAAELVAGVDTRGAARSALANCGHAAHNNDRNTKYSTLFNKTGNIFITFSYIL